MPHPLINDHADLATAIDVLDKWIEHTMHRQHLPGLAIGIIYDGALLWGKGYGSADVESQTPVTLDTHFRIASISKSFTATAILQLRDAGKLRLDDPAANYLDWFDLRYEDAPDITIHNLLTHTSGLPRDSHKPLFVEFDAPEWQTFGGMLATPFRNADSAHVLPPANSDESARPPAE